MEEREIVLIRAFLVQMEVAQKARRLQKKHPGTVYAEQAYKAETDALCDAWRVREVMGG